MLKDAGIDSVHWSDLGPATTPDPEIMEFAATNNLTILTNDLDFGIALASALRTKPSVVQIRSNDLRPTSIGKQVSQALNQMKEELEMGALVSIDPGRTRIRLLPLRKSN